MRTILVILRNPEEIEELRQKLAREDYHLIAIDCGILASDLLCQNQIDGVITEDPMNGLELESFLQVLHSHDRNTPAIVLKDYQDEKNEISLSKYPVSWIKRPFLSDGLIQILEEKLQVA